MFYCFRQIFGGTYNKTFILKISDDLQAIYDKRRTVRVSAGGFGMLPETTETTGTEGSPRVETQDAGCAGYMGSKRGRNPGNAGRGMAKHTLF